MTGFVGFTEAVISAIEGLDSNLLKSLLQSAFEQGWSIAQTPLGKQGTYTDSALGTIFIDPSWLPGAQDMAVRQSADRDRAGVNEGSPTADAITGNIRHLIGDQMIRGHAKTFAQKTQQHDRRVDI